MTPADQVQDTIGDLVDVARELTVADWNDPLVRVRIAVGFTSLTKALVEIDGRIHALETLA